MASSPLTAKARCRLFSGKVDLGTGVQTALAQIAAEELSAPLENVIVIQGDTALTPDQGVTWGSLTFRPVYHAWRLVAPHSLK